MAVDSHEQIIGLYHKHNWA